MEGGNGVKMGEFGVLGGEKRGNWGRGWEKGGKMGRKGEKWLKMRQNGGEMGGRGGKTGRQLNFGVPPPFPPTVGFGPGPTPPPCRQPGTCWRTTSWGRCCNRRSAVGPQPSCWCCMMR